MIPCKTAEFIWWRADIYSPQGCFHSYDSSLSLIQLTATRVGSGESVQGKTTHKGIKASVHFSKAFRVSYLMFQTSLMAFMSLKMHIRLQHFLPAALFRMQMQFNTIRQDRKPRHFTGSTAFQLSGKIKRHQLNRQAGQKPVFISGWFSDQHRTMQGGRAFFQKASSPATALHG